jgi:peptide/bleomycin uptake transporter
MGAAIGLPPLGPDEKAPIGLAYFFSPDNLWFYLYFTIFVLIFGFVWKAIARNHPWANWAIWGSAFIIFIAYFSVQVSVALNNWRGPFFDLFQAALSKQGNVTTDQLFTLQLRFLEIGMVGVVLNVITAFFTNHYVFRWRTAMNDYYMSKWSKLRHIEGASQRVQEDTMRFANILEGLGVTFINSIMTLVVFLPLLFRMSEYVGDLPVIGAVPHALFWLAIVWSLFGTALLAIAGIKLPGLQFRNQRVEAAYRKELVYGEDHADRADPVTVKELFANVRRNYFRMYWHYCYFNVARFGYGQLDAIFLNFILIPTIVAGRITMGTWQQIATAFGEVSNSFQYLVNYWSTIIELLSIHKRLKAFEAAIDDKPLPDIDERYLQRAADEGELAANEP